MNCSKYELVLMWLNVAFRLNHFHSIFKSNHTNQPGVSWQLLFFLSSSYFFFTSLKLLPLYNHFSIHLFVNRFIEKKKKHLQYFMMRHDIPVYLLFTLYNLYSISTGMFVFGKVVFVAVVVFVVVFVNSLLLIFIWFA